MNGTGLNTRVLIQNLKMNSLPFKTNKAAKRAQVLKRKLAKFDEGEMQSVPSEKNIYIFF